MKTIMTPKQMEFYRILLGERWEMMPTAMANAADDAKDKNGCYTSMLAMDYRFIGIAEFLVDQNVTSFQTNLTKGAELKLRHFRRFESREGIDASYVSMLAYKYLLDALAATDFTLATDLARVMGGRPEIEKEHDSNFDCAMGYALKDAVLEGDGSARQELIRALAGPDTKTAHGFRYSDFRGYGVVLDGIALRDETKVSSGLAELIEGHIRQANEGVFVETDDAYLCVWGIGLINLARSKGINVRVSHELTPRSLII
jgi:hypothetical protein